MAATGKKKKPVKKAIIEVDKDETVKIKKPKKAKKNKK
jgi:hypothetical protein